MNPSHVILGLETSCDETAAAVVSVNSDGTPGVLSSVIATQHDLHARYAGVVPEIASRAHVERMTPVIRDALREAGVGFGDLTGIAVGHRPGLIGSLLVGVSAAKAMSWSLGVPLIGVDHVAAHMHAGLLDAPPAMFPALGLVVSGGHTSLFHLASPLEMKLLGKTIDDAIGEAYDKVGTILGLPYPAGPEVDRLAQGGDPKAHAFPGAPLSRQTMDFSFSGLKTAVLYAVCGFPEGRGEAARFPRDASRLSPQQKADVAASFQHAAVGIVMRKLKRGIEHVKESGQPAVKSLLVGGGVSANTLLRERLAGFARDQSLELRLPATRYCLDNAAMIAGYALCRVQAGQHDDLTLAASAMSQLK